MTTEIDLELVRELNPADEGPSAQTRERARAALLAEVAREREPRRRPTRPRFGVRLGLAGAAVVAVALVLLLVGTRGGVVRPDRAAAALLHRAAGAAEASGGPRALRAGEYWYVHSRETGLGVAFGDTAHPLEITDARGSQDRQYWIGLGVRGRVIERAI